MQSPTLSVLVSQIISIVDDSPTLAELERRYINLILQRSGGNKLRAAKILGIDRSTLYRILARTENKESV